ncbi:hypothetical protein EV702DRAFT_1042444 [Suillus placidus]|uniref:Uncharacterized protein n=1 Tax=Suillus placidus TaxID=48579 RepID=A0A9P7A2T3_9AGAM|nr:hypothetical protein EV702DRAFT_1042444 [Suillus placidus]
MDGVDCGDEGDNSMVQKSCEGVVMVGRGGVAEGRDAQGAAIFTWQRAWWEEWRKDCIGECAADIEDHFHILWAPFLSPEGPGGFVINNSPPEDSLLDLMIPDFLVPDHCS